MLGSHPVLSGCQRGARGGAAPYPELLGWVVSMAAESSPLALSFNLLVHEAAAEEEPQLFDQSWRGLIIESLNPAFASPGVNVQREPQNVFRSFWCNLCQKKGTNLLR